jgi:hypothetical protein
LSEVFEKAAREIPRFFFEELQVNLQIVDRIEGDSS